MIYYDIPKRLLKLIEIFWIYFLGRAAPAVTVFFPFILMPHLLLAFFKTHLPFHYISHFFFIFTFRKSTSGFSFCSFHAISNLIKMMVESMQNVANQGLKELTIQHQGKKVNKAKRPKTGSCSSLGRETGQALCLLKQSTETTHEIQFQIKGLLWRWSRMARDYQRIQNEKEKKKIKAFGGQ